MVQSNVIVTYAPARRTPAAAPAREGTARIPKRVGMTLAGALLAGSAAFTVGTFVRPDGSIRQLGTARQPRAATATATPQREPAQANATPMGGPAPAAEESPLPFLALVREPAAAARPEAQRLSAPAIREAGRAARVAMRVERSQEPAAVASPAREDDAPAEVHLGVPTPSPAPAGQRRDLGGFLEEQGLILAADADTDAGAVEAVAPVSEWVADDLFVADDGAASQSAREAAPEPDMAALESSGELAEPVPRAPPVEPIADAPVALTQSPLEAEEQRSSATARPFTQANQAATEPLPHVAAAEIVLPPARSSAAARPEPVHIQSYPLAMVNGETLGAITLRDLGAAGAAIHLGALVELLKLKMPQGEFERLRTAAAADRFVTLEELREAGITVRHDARQDRLVIETR